MISIWLMRSCLRIIRLTGIPVKIILIKFYRLYTKSFCNLLKDRGFFWYCIVTACLWIQPKEVFLSFSHDSSKALYELKISRNIEIQRFFHVKVYFRVPDTLNVSSLRAFKWQNWNFLSKWQNNKQIKTKKKFILPKQ